MNFLFRGKVKESNEWKEGNLFMNSDVPFIADDYADFMDLDLGGMFEEVYPESVGIFTDETVYKDYATGFEHVDVFTGDILLFTRFNSEGAERKYVGVVEFVCGEFVLKCKTNVFRPRGTYTFSLYDTLVEDDGAKILGNITDNPELLDKEV